MDLRSADDPEIWDRARQLEAALITKDEDFAGRSSRMAVGPQIVWVRVGNATNPALMEWLTPRLPDIVALLQRGDRLIEVR